MPGLKCDCPLLGLFSTYPNDLGAIIFLSCCPRVLSPFRGGGIVYLNDPDSYAGWSFVLLLGPPKSDRLNGRYQTK